MADLIDFRKKVEGIQKIEEGRLNRLKIESLRKHFQCMRCSFRCARCGSQIADEEYEMSQPYNAPYPFCSVCYEEYCIYMKKSRGEPIDRKYYWFNREWEKAWEGWLNYQKAMEQYRESPEFLRLLDEVEKMLG
ncbi:MAG: hypothetical protein N2260_07105 [Syntrophobacterales bacterium]|nr:hypothetical protein [Syntrophobacterales bacterium]